MSKLNPTLLIIIIPFLLTLSLISPSLSLTSPNDIAALRAFISAIEPSSIPPTSCLATWNFSSDPCSVPRITHFTCGLTCSPDHRVVQLTLDSQSYSGTLTPLISKLTRLINLDLGDNNFHGPIPNTLSSLPNLKTLILSVNSFTGPVPSSVNSISSLETLDLSRNALTGALPDLNTLTRLTRLDISYNKLTGSLPKLPPNLNELALKSNSLSGPLSPSSFAGLTRLMVIELSENSFTGTLQPSLFLLPSLQQLDLAKNSFTNIIVSKPSSINNQLIAVDLGYNKLSGFLPANFGEYPMLRSLALSYNKLRGPIPWGYSRKGSSIKRLYLDGNFLNGLPPPGFFTGQGEVTGSLGDNCLRKCPVNSELCLKSQKPVAICQLAYGGKKKDKPMS